jgi:hypothetical protein
VQELGDEKKKLDDLQQQNKKLNEEVQGVNQEAYDKLQ